MGCWSWVLVGVIQAPLSIMVLSPSWGCWLWVVGFGMWIVCSGWLWGAGEFVSVHLKLVAGRLVWYIGSLYQTDTKAYWELRALVCGPCVPIKYCIFLVHMADQDRKLFEVVNFHSSCF